MWWRPQGRGPGWSQNIVAAPRTQTQKSTTVAAEMADQPLRLAGKQTLTKSWYRRGDGRTPAVYIQIQTAVPGIFDTTFSIGLPYRSLACIIPPWAAPPTPPFPA